MTVRSIQPSGIEHWPPWDALAWRRFAAAGEGHALLACHAAFFSALTPDLLYKIQQNFRQDEGGALIDIHTLAVSDLLLSALCREVGRNLFELIPHVRESLLQVLIKEENFGHQRITRLALFARYYLRDNATPIPSVAYREAMRWTSEAYLDPQAAAAELIALLEESRPDDPRLKKWLTLADQRRRLLEGGEKYKMGKDPLHIAVRLVQGLEAYRQGDSETSLSQLQSIADVLRKEEPRPGAPRVKVSENVLNSLRLPEDTTRSQQEGTRLTIKVHLLCDPGFYLSETNTSDGFPQLALDKERKDTPPLQFFEHSTPQITHENQILHFNLCSIGKSLPGDLDRLFITARSRYIIVVEWQREPYLTESIQYWISRLRVRLGTFSCFVLILDYFNITNPFIGSEPLEASLKRLFPEILRCFEFPLNKAQEILLKIWQETGYTPDLFYPLTSTFNQLLQPDAPRSIPYGQLEEMGLKKGLQKDAIAEFLHSAYHAGHFLYAGNASPDAEFLTDQVIVTNIRSFWHTLQNYYDTGPTPEAQWGSPNEPLKGFPMAVRTLASWQAYWEKDFPPDADDPSRRSFPGEALGIAKLLNAFDLVCFDEEKETLVFPLFLPEKPEEGIHAEIQLWLRSHSYTLFEYQFDFLPPGLFRRLIVRLADWTSAAVTQQEIVLLDAHILKSNVAKTVTIKSDDDTVTKINQIAEPLIKEYLFPYKTEHRAIPAHATPEMVFINGGTFQMGDVMGDKEYDDEKPVHEVLLHSYYLGAYPVTFEEFDAFCHATGRDKPNDQGWGRERRPVIDVDWYDAVEYCNWLSEVWGLEKAYTIDKKKKDPNNQSTSDDKKWTVGLNTQANGYRLPTEAEWEYAARALEGRGGGKVRFGNGKDIADPEEINFNTSKEYQKKYSKVGIYRQQTIPVGSFPPNSLGLYEMSGNVYDWCWDWYEEKYYSRFAKQPANNPTGPEKGDYRLLRGGVCYDSPAYVRVAYRFGRTPGGRFIVVGFRLARAR